MNTYGSTFPHASGLDGGADVVCSAYGVTSYPTMVVIAPDKTILEQDASSSSIIGVVEGHGGLQMECPEGLWADFIIEPVTVVIGNQIKFTDLSTGENFSRMWHFDTGTPANSNDSIVFVQYDTLGTYDVTIEVSNGIDVMFKTEQIHVVNPSAPNPDFVANETIVQVGDTVNFYDLSTDIPTTWDWIFQGGSPTFSSDTNPTGIVYNYPGTYNVYLNCDNAWGSAYATKYDYITVLAVEPPVEVCDTITNMLELDSLMVLEIDPWGVVPGNNELGYKAYADKFVNNFNYDKIDGMVAKVHVASGSSNGKVKFHIWEEDSITLMPGASVGSKEFFISDFTPNFAQFVLFDNPVEISGNFFMGYEVFYFGYDVFATSMAKHRGQWGSSTLYIQKSNTQWVASKDLPIINSPHTSLAIEPIACSSDTSVFGVNEVEFVQSNISLYPNPTTGKVTLAFSDDSCDNCEIKIFSLTGTMLELSHKNTSFSTKELDFSQQPNGIYFINIVSDKEVVTKKLILSR